MREEKQEVLTVGEIAKVLGINKNTVLHYDRQGLIQSVRKDNNYRYYYENQINSFKIVLSLRKMGFSIEKIKQMNKHLILKDYSFIVDMIKQREKECLKNIEDIRKNLKNLEIHREYMEYFKEISLKNPNSISLDIQNYKFLKNKDEFFCIKDFEEERGIVVDIKNHKDEIKYISEKLKNYNFNEEWTEKYFFSYIVQKSDFLDFNFIKSKIFIRKDIKNYPEKYIFSKGEYAVFYVESNISEEEAFVKCYKKIKENGYEIAGDLFVEKLSLFDSSENLKIGEKFDIMILKIPVNLL